MLVRELPTRLTKVHYAAFAGLLAVAVVVTSVWWVGFRGSTAPAPASHPKNGPLPGMQMWNGTVSSLLFGTNDSYEWSQSNLETQPALQADLRTAGFTLIRSFYPDNASDAVIEQRIKTIENSGAHCLGVITNINNLSFDEHLVRYLGNRCQLYEFGNEPDYNGITIDKYLAAWNHTIPLLRKVNPNAKFIGPVTGVGQYMQSFLEGVATSGVQPDAVSLHWYPCWNDTESSCLAKASTFGPMVSQAKQMVMSTLGKQLPVGVSEWNYDPGNPPPAYGDDNAFITQFSTRALQSMIQAGAAFACQFDSANYGGYGRLDMLDVEKVAPKPQFYAIAAMISKYRPGQHPKVSAPAPTQSTAAAPAADAFISVGKQATCSSNDSGPGGAAALVDGKHGNWAFWNTKQSDLPAWCAINVPRGPTRLLLVWEMDFTSDYITPYASTPRDYTISVSPNSTNGSDGTWHTVTTVTGNETRVREDLVPFAGQSWVKMTVTKGQAGQTDLTVNKINLFDVSSSLNDTYFFSGDSITLFSYNQFDVHQPSFAADVHSAWPNRFPATMDGGLGGWLSGGAVQNIDSWLALNPDMHYWLLGWGSNDALNMVSPADFRTNLQTLVTKIQAAGHVPVLAHIPYSTFRNLPGLDDEVKNLNAVIDQVTQQDGLTPGPDFYTLIKQNPSYLSSDGLHPTDQGAIAMNKAWYEALRQKIA